MNNRRRSYRAGESVVINAVAPGSMRVVVERIEKRRVTLGFQLPLDWALTDERECKEAS